jgi:Tfp pilus assembly protein PilN
MMRRLELDFQRKSMPVSGAGVVLLIAALLLGATLYVDYRDLAVEVDQGEAKLARLERLTGHKAPRPVKKDTDLSAAETKRAVEVMGQLTLPWDELFAAVEDAAGKDVALLAIQPDRRKGQVTIGGEAKNVTAMLDYMRRLGEEAPLKEVALLSHQIQLQDPQQPVRFNLSARWITK